MNVIKVDEALCSQCKACYRACWIDVIRWDDERDRPVIAYPDGYAVVEARIITNRAVASS